MASNGSYSDREVYTTTMNIIKSQPLLKHIGKMIDAIEVARGVGDESACASIAKIQALLSRQSMHDELSQCTRLRKNPLNKI